MCLVTTHFLAFMLHFAIANEISDLLTSVNTSYIDTRQRSIYSWISWRAWKYNLVAAAIISRTTFCDL